MLLTCRLRWGGTLVVRSEVNGWLSCTLIDLDFPSGLGNPINSVNILDDEV